MRPNHLLQKMPRSYIREILSEAKKPGVISLAGGLPSTQALPLALFQRALAVTDLRADLLQYGETQGYEPLLAWFTEYTSDVGHSSMVCSGAQQGLDLIARAFINPGDIVVAEAPCYLGALQVFGLSQATVRCVRQTAIGPDLNQLESLFAAGRVAFFYGVPDFHNPTGVCWSQATRQQVANLCAQYGVFFVEDSPYRQLRFAETGLPQVSTLCPDYSVQVKSFSKYVAPAFRLASITGPKPVIDTLIKVKQIADLHTAVPLQALLLTMLQDAEFPVYLNALRQTYWQKYQTFNDVFSQFNFDTCHFQPIHGGMFLWLSVSNYDTDTLASDLLREKVCVVPASVFYPQGESGESALRLNYTHCDSDALWVALSTLHKVLQFAS